MAFGTGSPLTIPDGTAPGVVTIVMGNPESVLNGHTADGTMVGPYTSTLDKGAGTTDADDTLATFTICG